MFLALVLHGLLLVPASECTVNASTSMTKSQAQDLLVEARALLARGDLAGCARHCRLILKQNRSHPEALFMLGRCSFSAAKQLKGQSQDQAYLEAEQAFLKLLKVDAEPKDSRVLQSLALCALHRGASTAALSHALKAVELEPTSATALRVQGECATAVGNRKLAVDSFRQSNALDPDDVNVIHLLSESLRENERPVEAIELLEQRIARLPAGTAPYNQLSLVLYSTHLSINDPHAAHDVIEKTAISAPNDLAVTMELCFSLYRVGKPDLARQQCLQFRAKGGDRLSVLQRGLAARLMGQIHAHLGEHGEAVKELESCLQHTPDDLSALQTLAGSLRRLKREERARSTLKRYRQVRESLAIAEQPGHIALTDGDGLQRQEQLIRALVTLRRFDRARQELARRQRFASNDQMNEELGQLIESEKSP